MQKRAIGILHNVGYQEHTNLLFLQSRSLKFSDIVNHQTAQLMFNAKRPSAPKNFYLNTIAVTYPKFLCCPYPLQYWHIRYRPKVNIGHP